MEGMVDLIGRSVKLVYLMNKAIAGEEFSKKSEHDSKVGDLLNTSSEESVPPLEELGELPRSYGTDSIFLVAQEPHWLFTYWDIDISLHPGGKTFLRVYGAGDQQETEIEVSFETRNWYIPVKHAGA